MKRRLVVLLSLCLLVIPVVAVALWVQAQQRQYTLNRQLIAALMKGDARQALALVNTGADPNTHCEPPPEPSFELWLDELLHRPYPQIDHFSTAFVLACGAGCDVPNVVCTGLQQTPEDVKLIQTMLAHGADPNAHVQIGGPVINIAVSLNHVRVAEQLVTHGANVNYYGGGAGTPLMSAIANDNPSMLHLLLTHGADPNLANNHGMTPLKLARQSNRPNLVTLLKQAGARR